MKINPEYVDGEPICVGTICSAYSTYCPDTTNRDPVEGYLCIPALCQDRDVLKEKVRRLEEGKLSKQNTMMAADMAMVGARDAFTEREETTTRVEGAELVKEASGPYNCPKHGITQTIYKGGISFFTSCPFCALDAIRKGTPDSLSVSKDKE